MKHLGPWSKNPRQTQNPNRFWKLSRPLSQNQNPLLRQNQNGVDGGQKAKYRQHHTL
jgi:hypothetical protein